ncbi:hypothetical protein ACOHYD_13510 [Desulfobacterota bacterium M19]
MMGKTIYRKFFSSNGKINVKGSFLSPRLTREALEKHFRIVPIDESPNIMRYKIVRFARLYGAPVIYPSSQLSIVVNKDTEEMTYNFVWPEWIMVILVAVGMGAGGAQFFNPGASVIEQVIDGVKIFMSVLCIHGGMVFLDTKYVASKIHKALSSL